MEPYQKISAKNNNKGLPLIKCLSACENRSELTVIGVNAGFQAKKRLADLGVVPGVKIFKKNSAPWKGPVEIIVKGSALVLGRGLASKILVNCEKTCEL